MRFPDAARAVLRRAATTLHESRSTLTQDDLAELKLLAAQPSIQRIRATQARSVREVELRVFSQFGDDGILQYLTTRLGISRGTFVEFGVQDYRESNTRLLLINDNWRGLVMDGSAENIASIRAQDISWRHDVSSVVAFITRENINSLLVNAGFGGPLDILSIDIDGNDYWVWDAITTVDPLIVVVEYNSLFGKGRAVTVPYDASFHRTRAHHSNLFWGASIRALTLLAERKGYVLVGGNAAGNNLHFVKRDRAGDLPKPPIAEAYVDSRFRESRDTLGALTFVSGARRRDLIADMMVQDVESGELVRLGSLDS